MKKSKLSIGLVTSFIAAMALSACGQTVTKDDDNLVTFKGYSDEDLAVEVETIYADYLKGSSGISKYYDQVLEVLIRHAFSKSQKDSNYLANVKKSYKQIENEAKDNLKGAKATAKQNAETNGTDYKTEWQSVLSEKGVKDEAELLQYYIYQIEKDVIEDWYFDQHEDSLKAEYLGISENGKAINNKGEESEDKNLSSKFPYHVRHILIKVEDGGSDYVRGTISESQAKLLSETVERLAAGDRFGQVAQDYSEDSSASSYGDVGLMTNNISSGKLGMVNEFQLGIYAYDAIQYHDGDNAVIDEALGLNKEVTYGKFSTKATDKVKNVFQSRAITEIPYSVFKELGDVADLENNFSTGIAVEDGKAAIYPRNLLWNRYLNNHDIFVITNSERNNIADITTTTREDIDVNSNHYIAGEDSYVKYDETAKKINYANLKGFKNESTEVAAKVKAGSLQSGQKVLADEKGNVIIGVRSQYGIHLMIVERSIYEWTLNGVTLPEYYTTLTPSDAEYPGKAEGTPKTTYVNFIESVNKSEYNTRAETIRNAIKGFDSTYDYRLYEELLEKASSAINMEDETTKSLTSAIANYIDVQREKNAHNQDIGMQEVWQTYIELLDTQNFYRQELDRIVPEGCKIGFTKETLTEAEKEAYKEGGRCYVK